MIRAKEELAFMNKQILCLNDWVLLVPLRITAMPGFLKPSKGVFGVALHHCAARLRFHMLHASSRQASMRNSP
jgi:hypothetical protein